MGDFVDLDWLENELKKNGNVFNISKLTSVEITPAVNDGDNYASRLLRLQLQALINDGKQKNISVILKRKLNTENFGSNVSVLSVLHEAFLRECNFYLNIFPLFESVLGGEEKLRPECLASIKSEDLYLEDLKDAGYRISNRLVGLDTDHCNLVFEAVGRFHAASTVVVSKGLIDIDMFNKYPQIDGTTGEINRKSNPYDFIADVIYNDWEPEWKPLGEKLEKIKTSIRPAVQDIGVRDPSRLNVINHGDLWVNNIMFKYSNQGKPIALRFVDFQLPHYNSFAFDLSYFLNTSVSGELKPTQLESWINIYCASFKKIIDQQHCHLPCPNPDIVRAELKRIVPFSVNICTRVRPVIMCRPEDSIPLSELVKDNGLTKEKRKIYENPNLSKELKIDLPILLEQLESSTSLL